MIVFDKIKPPIFILLLIALSSCSNTYKIHTMAQRGDVTGVAKYLNDQGDVNQKTKKAWLSGTGTGLTPLHFAIMGNQYEMAALLIEHGADIASPSSHGTPLYLATNLAASKILTLLLLKATDAELSKSEHQLLLHIAVSSRHLSPAQIKKTNSFIRRAEAVKILLEYGFAVDHRDKNGETAFMHAVKANNIQAMELLKKYGANIHIYDDSKENALFKVSERQFKRTDEQRDLEYKIFRWLIDNKMDIQTNNAAGDSLLHKNCNIKIMAYLLKNGLDHDSKNNYGNSPLHNIIQYCPASVINQLLANGASFKAQNTSGLTPFHILLYTRTKENLSKAYISPYLTGKISDINSVDIYGRGYLHIILSNSRNLWLIDDLIQKGININLADNYGCTALQIAFNVEGKKLSRMIRGPSLDIYQQDNYSEIKAEISKMNKLVKKLVKAGAHINHKNKNGQTILHMVAMNRILSQAYIDSLLKLGAKKDIRDKSGYLPYDLATRFHANDQKILSALKPHDHIAATADKLPVRNTSCGNFIFRHNRLDVIAINSEKGA